MTYDKPELTVLGDATDLIKGVHAKAFQLETAGNNCLPADCEFDN